MEFATVKAAVSVGDPAGCGEGRAGTAGAGTRCRLVRAAHRGNERLQAHGGSGRAGGTNLEQIAH